MWATSCQPSWHRTRRATLTGVALPYILAHPVILHDHVLLIDKITSPQRAGLSEALGVGYFLTAILALISQSDTHGCRPAGSSPPTPRSSMIILHMVTHHHYVHMIRMSWGISTGLALGHLDPTCQFPRQLGRVV